ncbi:MULTISPECIES: mechanosensitive ion channel domain-containing protein [Arenibacter]|uniref:mechanosensitive ion channel family protein n=1 Tax=Arenibacter TaxID=178469 RepID=UPI001C06EB75|nr:MULTISPECIES: mechanosensitive ion channel domain-containing protein [Arenibacter]MBU2906427.1 mechanosensitive ion channel [Arenibacter algicola]MCK0137143.1 mechanosensitive ion channel [Arenibacter sp. S6351L]
MDTLSKLLDFNLISIGDYKIKVYSLVIILLILLITKVIVQLIKKALFRRYKGVHFDTGNTYALYQIIKYVIWVIAIGFILESIGVKLTLFLAGSAALLVGVGLGLQQTFNDIISGIILLSEKSIKINDILEIDGDIVEIQEIGLRTSRGLNRNDISIIIPNSLITTNKVINWSHQKRKTRFKIGVGVAYGSNVDLVVKILEESVLEHPDFEDGKSIEGRFVNFGNSSLDFEVLFFSENVFRIEKVKSDIRKIINRKFSENKIVIPFPQMDLHFKSGHTEIFPKNE